MTDQNGRLPEGTDAIIVGASAENEVDELTEGADALLAGAADQPDQRASGAGNTDDAAAQIGGGFASAREKLLNETEGLRAQAGDTVRTYALQGKDRTTDALDNIVKLVSGAADTIEEKLGPQYAGYARSAAGSVGNVADTLRAKDIDELVEDAKTFVKNSPGIAIGAAAAIGFVVARLAKAGTSGSATADNDAASGSSTDKA